MKGIIVRSGFPKLWIERVMRCVSTPSFSECVNGKEYGTILPTRGLRQGDPLSPYLFLLCAEGFSALLAKSKEKGRIKGVAVCRNAPCISHLLFADDSLLFCQVSLEEVQCVTDIL